MSQIVAPQQEAPNEDSFEAGWNEEAGKGTAPAVAPVQEPEAAAPSAEPAAPSAEPAVAPVQEPLPGTEPEAVPASPVPPVDDEERRRIANEQSMQGRLEAERRKSEALAARLASIEAQQGAATQAPQPVQQQAAHEITAQVKPRTEMFGAAIRADQVDDDTKALIDEFAKVNPELAPLVIENSKEGERMRRILNEFGADYTATAAEMTVKTRQLDIAEFSRVQATQRAYVENHYKTLVREHPEFEAELVGTSDEAIGKRSSLQADMQAWIRTLPYEQGVFAQQAITGGTTEQVSFVLGKFKEARQAASQLVPPTQPLPSAETQRAAAAGFAVPARGAAALPRPKPDKNDWNEAWA